MILKIIPCGAYEANCYILGDENTNKAVIVDPGDDAEDILSVCKENNLEVQYILLTHGHADHIGAVKKLKEQLGCPVGINKKDEYLIKGAAKLVTPMLAGIELFDADMYLSQGDVLKVGELDIEVIETPGHTPGGVSFKIGDIVLTGDSLFRGSIGRCDFEFGDMNLLINMIKERLMCLDDKIRVYPGHGPSTTIERERIFNPYLA